MWYVSLRRVLQLVPMAVLTDMLNPVVRVTVVLAVAVIPAASLARVLPSNLVVCYCGLSSFSVVSGP